MTSSPPTETHSNGKSVSQSQMLAAADMPSPQNQIALKQQSYGGLAVPLREDEQGKKDLAVELFDRFQAMKIYGKEPESLESITRIFCKDLSAYPTEQVMKAISYHSQRNNEFPTPADIIGLIKRKGKPPIKESDIIAIRKKDGESRTKEEWQMLREWDNQQQDEWEDEFDEHKQQNMIQENMRLRQALRDAETENRRLAALIGEKRQADEEKKLLVRLVPSREEQIRDTIGAMRATGAKEEDIAEFEKQMGVAA